MPITHITSLSQLNRLLTNDKVSVIDFHAEWCGPCHQIAPVYESLSKQYPTVQFMKCDVDAAKEVSTQYSVSAMPTFIFLKGKTQVDKVRGADRNGIESALRRHAPSSASTSAFSGRGQTLGATSSSSTTPVASPKAVPRVPTAPRAAPRAQATFGSGLDPNFQTFLLLLAAYIFFYTMS